ncbi:MAG TPA: ABC transporter substrate-binding protein [Acidimicrobiales bacterium]
MSRASVRSSRRGGARRWAVLIALAVLATACASVSSGSTQPSGGDDDDADAGPPQYGGRMVYGLEAETTSGWCLQEAQLAISGIQVARAIYDTLTVPDGEGGFRPFLAQSVEPNADYTQWTITLREGVVFHDGSPLTAEVVKNNLDAYRGEYPARSSLLFSFVLQDIETVEVTGPLEVTVTTSRPWVAFPSFLYSSGRLGITGQAQLDDAENCGRNLIGTGPFKLEEWRVNDHLTVVRNENYWRTDENGNQLPYLDEIEFRPMVEAQQRVNALKSGEIDAFHVSSNTGALTIDEMRALDEAEQVNLAESEANAEVGFLMLNATRPPFNNPIARRAAALALERELSNEILSRGIATLANGPFPPGSIGYVEETGYESDDPEQARELVEQYERETGERLAFQIGGPPDPETVALVALAREQFEAVGMDVSTTTFEQSALIQTAIEKNYDALTFRNYPALDPDNLYVWWYNGETNPVNFMGFNDPEVNDLLDRGRVTADPAQRNEIYQELNRELARENYMLWASWTIWAVPMQPEFHNVVGARPPDGGSDYEGLALGHDMALVWKEQ